MDDKGLDRLIDEIWKIYDTDQNGYLDKREARLLFKDVYAVRGDRLSFKEMERIMGLIDTNGDGLMDKGEIKSVLK